MANHASFAVITFSKTNSFAQINTARIISNFQKDSHHNNLSFACLKSHKNDCLNIFAGNICSGIQAKSQLKCCKRFNF